MADTPFRNSRLRPPPGETPLQPRDREMLQDKMLEDDQELKKRRDASRSEMMAKLPPLPHEIEIKAELKDEEELLKLYEELEIKKKEAVEKRREIALKKVDKIEKEKQERLGRLQ
jgi:hypothetical protein